LDFGLLEARKAELAVQEGQKFDDELDAVLEKSEPDQSTSEAGPGPSTTGQAAQKRSREDIMNALKESRKRLTGAGQDEQRESKRVKVEQPAPGLGGRFKSIAKAKAETEAAEEAAKLKKKKKKKVKTVTVTAPESVEAVPEAISFVQKPLKTETPTIQSIAMTATKEKSVEQKTETPVVPAEPDLAPEPVAMPAARLPIPPLPLVEKLPVPGSESEDDIFGGVGDYELGIGSDSSSEEDDEDKPKKPLKRERVPEMNPLTAKKGKGWFGDDEEEDLSTRSMLPDILRATRPAESSAVGSQRGLSRSPSPGDGTLRRLQPLSSSRLPSAKELLELDAAATADEKKRERKAKWRAKQGLPSQGGQEDDDEDTRRSEKDREGDEKRKLNRETQQLQNYMAKQKS
jgi:IK cytokine